MDITDKLFSKYGVYPKLEDRNEIRDLLMKEIENEGNNEDHENMRVLCFMLFQIGVIEDCELIWKAKMLNMDAGCMIDTQLLCGAGYTQTIRYSEKKNLASMKNFLEKYLGEDFEKSEIVEDFKSYYGV